MLCSVINYLPPQTHFPHRTRFHFFVFNPLMTNVQLIKKLTRKIEKQKKHVDNPFQSINPEYFLQNETKFCKVFDYFTPNEYQFIKKYKSIKAVNAYVEKYTLSQSEVKFWLEVANTSKKRIQKLELDNLEFIKSLDSEFAYEVLLYNNYTDKITYSSKERKSPKYYKILACNSLEYLEELVFKHSLVEPYVIRVFYTKVAIDDNSKVIKHILKMHAISPSFYSCYILNKQPKKKALRGYIDTNMIGFLNDFSLLTFLFEKYERENNKMAIIETLMQHKRKLENIEEFILDNILVSDAISDFLAIITGRLSNTKDWFSIFYNKNIDYKQYKSFYQKIYKINHFVIPDVERIEYFLEFAFYRSNFLATFDPLNYTILFPNEFLKKHFYGRSDIDFYMQLPTSLKENINPVYVDSPVLSKNSKNSVYYYNSFANATPKLLETKLGIFYLEQKIHELAADKVGALLRINKMLNHPLNEYIDKFIWENYTDISSFCNDFKKQHDNYLNNILTGVNCKLDIKIYKKYKIYKNECAKHMSDNYTLNEMAQSYHIIPDLIILAFLKRMEVDFDTVIEYLQTKAAYQKMLNVIIEHSSKTISHELYKKLNENFEKNISLLFLISNKDTKLFEQFLLSIKDICTLEEAKSIAKQISEKNMKVCYTGNLFFNIATNTDSLVKETPANTRYIIEIHDYYKPYIIDNFDYILGQALDTKCSEEWVEKSIEIICKDGVALFAVKDKIREVIICNPSTKVLKFVSNKEGYFTEELFAMTKHFATSKIANKVLQTTATDDFLKLSDKDLISYLHKMTFDCFLDEVSAKYLLYRLNDILFTMQRTTFDREFCKSVFRTVQTLNNIIYGCNYDLLLTNLVNLTSDDRFTAELATIFDKLASLDRKIIDTLVQMLDKNINISKILVSILLQIEKSDPVYVENTCAFVLTKTDNDKDFAESKNIINFLAYAPTLQSFSKYKNKFLNELKEIYLGTNSFVATKAFAKLYSNDVRNYVIGSSFTDARKSEALYIIENNFDPEDPNLFAFIYILKFDKNEKYRSKAHELWIKNFKQGVITAIIPYIIIMCYYYRDDELLFESAIYDFISKYSENIEKSVIEILQCYIQIEDNNDTHLKIKYLEQSGCLNKCVEDFEHTLLECTCYFVKEGLKLDLLKNAALMFLQFRVDIEIVHTLLNEAKFQEDLLRLIFENKIEFELVLENKEFVDEIYKKTNDVNLLPYVSVATKMQELTKENQNIDALFQNITPSKEWEQFLATANPTYSKQYLMNFVTDFGGLKLIFERVCEECTEIDELIDIFYIEYLKDVSFKNFKDKGKIVNLLLSTKKYKRLRELQSHMTCDVVCQILKLSLKEPEIIAVLNGLESNNTVLSDYLEIVK